MPGEYQKPLRLVSTGGGMRYYRSNETALEGARAQGRGMYQLESVRGGGGTSASSPRTSRQRWRCSGFARCGRIHRLKFWPISMRAVSWFGVL